MISNEQKILIFDKIVDFFKDGQLLCDVNLKAGSTSVRAHRLMLAAVSPFFEKMFRGNMVESRAEDINIGGVESSVLEPIVSFLYSGDIDLNWGNIQMILEGAAYLQLKSLKDHCEAYMVPKISNENALKMVKYAEMMSCPKLLEASNKFVAENFEGITKSKEFLEINVEELLALLQRNDLMIKEEKVYEASLAWIRNDIEKRKEFFDKIFECIRLPLMEPRYISEKIENEELVLSSRDCLKIILESKNHFIPKMQSELEITQRTQPRGNIGKHFVFGGWSFEAFNLLKKTWETIESMPEKKRTYFGRVMLNEKLFVIGGEMDGKITATMEIYDFKTSIWNKGPNLLVPRGGLSASVLNGCIYVCGGFDGTSHFNSVECSCIESNMWRNVKPMKEAREASCSVALNGFLYVIGGFCKGSALSSAERYDAKTDSWTSIRPMTAARYSASAIGFKGKIYVCGGKDERHQLINSVEVYDPVKDEWKTVRPMKERRHLADLCVYMDEIWVCGGRNSLSVEKYNPETDTWSDGPKMHKSKGSGVAGVFSSTL